MKRSNAHPRAKVFAVIILLGLMCFLYWNFGTTKSVLTWTLGNSLEIAALAVGVSLVDLAGLARLFTPAKSMKEESFFIWVLTGVWLVSVGTDVILTYFYVVWKMSMIAPNMPVEVSGMVNWFPWAVALIEVGIRVPLVLLVGQYGDQLLHGTKGETFSDALDRVFATPNKQRAPQPVATRRSTNPQRNNKTTPRMHVSQTKGSTSNYRAEDYIG